MHIQEVSKCLRLFVARLAVETLKALADSGRIVALAASGTVSTRLIAVAAQGIRPGQTFLKDYGERMSVN
jgi:hypothetical protein